jgi:hypothetical protein
VTLGEFKVNFSGRDRVHAKRKALDYWYNNRDVLGLSVMDFFRRCRLSPDERTITFIPSISGNVKAI